ncbi:formimidoylglutamase [Paracoccus jeotgali]|uniref:formimidoylglutamase n=1 Tax=Paracoccus jeotgali TaxID=2065379 RepID=UPI0028AEB77D|nr:formimidoylglutamase [Paracoccus jeotgali]
MNDAPNDIVSHLPAPEWQGRSDPEDGARTLRLHHIANRDGADRALIGFACDAGVIRNQGQPGAAQGPQAIRQAMANLSAPEGLPGFHDHGDVVLAGEDPGPGQQALGLAVAGLLRDHARVLVLGGGHETAVGSWQGLRAALPDARIGIVNIDAHPDIRAIGAAGASSGTPFFQIHQTEPDRFDYAVLGLAAEGNTLALTDRAQEWGVTVVPDHALQRGAEAAYPAIDAIAARCDTIYLSVDLDVLPASLAPGVSSPAARGVPLHVVEAMIDRVLATGKVRLADIVELSPPHDPAGLTARVAALIARRLLAG